MGRSLDINFVIPHDQISGGIKAVSKIAKYAECLGNNVNIIAPKLPIIMGCDLVSNIQINKFRKIVDGICDKKEIKDRSKINEWRNSGTGIIKIPHFQAHFHNLIGSDIPNADITIATSWRTAYGVNKLPKHKGRKYYLMQGYEIWPVWQKQKYWDIVTRKYPDRDATIQMANVTPTSFQDKIFKNYVDQSYKLGMGIIVTSEWEKKVLNHHGVKPLGKVTLGVETDFCQSTNNTNEELTLTGIYRNSMTKGDHELVASFENINEKYTNVKFTMFGPGKFDEIPEFVNYFPNPSDDKISEILGNSDIFIFPSWVEGFGLPPLEAMACGCVVISTSTGAIHEYAPRSAIKFIPRNDVESIVEAFEEYKNNDSLQRSKTEARIAAKQYSWEETAEVFLDIIGSNE